MGKDLEMFAVFFLHIAAQTYSFWQYSSSTLAAAVLFAARRSIDVTPYNNKKMKNIYECNDDQMKECFDKLWAEYRKCFPKNADCMKLRSHNLLSDQEILF